MIFHWFFAISVSHAYRPLLYAKSAFHALVSISQAQEAWLEKYSICLEQQLAQEITIYRGKLQTYYAEWESADLGQDLEFDRISLPDTDTDSLSLSSTTYKGNADFCDLE